MNHINWPLLICIILVVIAINIWIWWHDDDDEYEEYRNGYTYQLPHTSLYLYPPPMQQSKVANRINKQMSVFKVGDKVEIVKNDSSHSSEYVGKITTIAAYLESNSDARYHWKLAGIGDVYNSTYNCWADWELKIVNKKSTMEKITNAFKKFLNPDLQAQVKAGYRNGGLELTEVGKTVALEALLEATPSAQSAFTASANEAIAEEEKKNNS